MNSIDIVLTKREIGIFGLIVFLVYNQFDDIDFNAITGRSEEERDSAILAIKKSIAEETIHSSLECKCTLQENDVYTLSRLIDQIGDGSSLREAGFDVNENEILVLKKKFS